MGKEHILSAKRQAVELQISAAIDLVNNSHLTLAGFGDDKVAYFEKLANEVIPQQQHILGEELPLLYEKLKKIEAEIQSLTSKYDFILTDPYQPLRNYSDIAFIPTISWFVDNSPIKARGLMREFLSSRSGRIFNAISRFKTDGGDRDEFGRYLTATIFEEIAYIHLSQAVFAPQNMTLLSPSETFILFENANHEKEIAVNQHGLVCNVFGVSSPDGLVIKEERDSLRLVKAIEYKNVNGAVVREEDYQQRSDTQRQWFSGPQIRQNLSHTRYPAIDAIFLGRLINILGLTSGVKPLIIDPNLEVEYAVPSNSHFKMGDSIVKIPITTGNIHQFSNRLFDVG